MFNPSRSLLAGGRTTAQLTADLANAQQAYIQLQTGALLEFVGYGQGDGQKHVRYTKAELPTLAALIQLLQAQLGIVQRPRRPLRFLVG